MGIPARPAPRREQLRQRASIEPVGLRARLADPRVTGMHDQHLADVRLEIRAISQALPVTPTPPFARAQLCANTRVAGVDSIPPPNDLARLHDRHLASHGGVQPNAPHPSPLLAVDQKGTGGKRQRRFGSQPPGPVAGAATEKSGSKAHRARNGLPSLRSPGSPLSRSADRKHRPGQQPPSGSFMPRQGGVNAPARAGRSGGVKGRTCALQAGSFVLARRCRGRRSSPRVVGGWQLVELARLWHRVGAWRRESRPGWRGTRTVRSMRPWPHGGVMRAPGGEV